MLEQRADVLDWMRGREQRVRVTNKLRAANVAISAMALYGIVLEAGRASKHACSADYSLALVDRCENQISHHNRHTPAPK